MPWAMCEDWEGHQLQEGDKILMKIKKAMGNAKTRKAMNHTKAKKAINYTKVKKVMNLMITKKATWVT